MRIEHPEAWSNGLSVLVMMNESPSAGGYTLGIERAEAFLLQLQSAIRSAKASQPIISELMAARRDAEGKKERA